MPGMGESRSESARLDMLHEMLDAQDVAAYAFDKNRRILYANKKAAELSIGGPGSAIGAAEKNHFTDNQYFDEKGNQITFPGRNGSMIDRALRNEETRDFILEHRDVKK